MCMTAQDPECMNRALNTILDTLKNGSKLSAAEKRDAMETHCRRAGILARDTTKLNDLGEMGHIKGAAFAAYDYESCGAGDNRAHRECYFAGDVACIRDAAAPLDRKLFPAQR